MSVICIYGVCIPYSVFLPLILIIIKPFWEFLLKLFGKKSNLTKSDKDSTIETVDLNIDKIIKKRIPYNLTTEDGESFLNNLIHSGRTIIIRFTAKWCKPCKAIDPLIDKLAEENEELIFVNIDVDTFDEIAAKYLALQIPLLISFRNKIEYKRLKSSDETLIREFIMKMENQSDLHVPRASVKRIMKINQEVGLISADSLAATCKATEAFVADLAKTCSEIAISSGRKTIRIEDIMTAAQLSKYEFLEGAFTSNYRSHNNNSSSNS